MFRTLCFAVTLVTFVSGANATAQQRRSLATPEPFGDEAKYLSNIRQLTYEDMGFRNAG